MKLTQLILTAAGAVSQVNANLWVMQDIISSIEKLEAQGFYKQELKPDSVLGQPKYCASPSNRVLIGEEFFNCSNVDFYSFLSLTDLEIPELGHQHGFRSADIWGWLTPTNREFTLIALDNGVAVVDSTDPVHPCVIAKMPTSRYVDIWADVKVLDNTMYHVKDKRGGDTAETSGSGIEVYDLLPLDNLDCHAEGFEAPYVEPNFIFTDHGRSHNIVANPESKRLYSVGTEKCNGGFMIIDASNRLEPVQIGCADADGYTHDAQCLVYDGPDADYTGREICFGFNEDTLTVWDLTDASNPIMVSRTGYPNQVYSHQGWVNNDLTKVLLDDEIDERCNNGVASAAQCASYPQMGLTGLKTTSTNVFNIIDLDNPIYEGPYVHSDESIDHNLYVWGVLHRKGWGGNPPLEYYPDPNYAYMNNYLAGLKIVDIRSDDYNEWTSAGYFDISPNQKGFDYAGAWSGYMHPSGVYAISSIERGLFLLKPRMAFTDEFPPPPHTPDTPELPDTDLETLLLALAALALALAASLICMLCCGYKSTAKDTTEEVDAKELVA